MDCSPSGSSVHGILQARILEWVAMPSCRGSCPPRDWIQVSRIAGGFFVVWATREAYKEDERRQYMQSPSSVHTCPSPHLMEQRPQVGARVPAGCWPLRVQHLRSHLFFSTSLSVILPFCPAFTPISKVRSWNLRGFPPSRSFLHSPKKKNLKTHHETPMLHVNFIICLPFKNPTGDHVLPGSLTFCRWLSVF